MCPESESIISKITDFQDYIAKRDVDFYANLVRGPPQVVDEESTSVIELGDYIFFLSEFVLFVAPKKLQFRCKNQANPFFFSFLFNFFLKITKCYNYF